MLPQVHDTPGMPRWITGEAATPSIDAVNTSTVQQILKAFCPPLTHGTVFKQRTVRRMRIRATVLESVPCKIGIVDCQNTVERRYSRRRCLKKWLNSTLHLGKIRIEPSDRLLVSLGVIWHKQDFFTVAAVVHTSQEMNELGTVAAHKLYERLDGIHARVRRDLAALLPVEHALE